MDQSSKAALTITASFIAQSNMPSCAAESTASTAASDAAFVGRQPIFDSRMEVHGYELLFRNGTGNSAVITDGDKATASVLLNTFTDIGLDTIAGKKKAFVNLTRNLLLSRNLSCLPADRVVLEILEDIEPDNEVLAAAKDLADLGYTIALDDFVFSPDLVPLIDLASIVKIEFPAIPHNELPDHIQTLRDLNVETILAEKIETQEDYELCRSLGCDLFQGYFFSKPQVVSGQKVQVNIGSVVRLVAELNNPDITLDEVETIIQSDAQLSFKLLRFVNSANAAMARYVESLKQAATLLGLSRLRSLASMLLLTSIDEEKPRELINMALIRGKMCEVIASENNLHRPDRFYTVGLVSLMDALIDRPMKEIIQLLPLAPDMNEALVHRTGELGKILRAVINFETQHQASGGLTNEQFERAYEKALSWITNNGLAV